MTSKMDDTKERYALIQFENGTIHLSFDNESLLIEFNNGQKLTIRINDSFNGKYAVQVDLIRRVYDGEIAAKDVDGLDLQVETIRWLLELNKKYVIKEE